MHTCSIATGHWWLDKHMTGKYAVPVASSASAVTAAAAAIAPTDGAGGVQQQQQYTVLLEGNFPYDK